MARLWFKRHRYGFGWTPASWQGVAVILAALAVVLGTAGLLSALASEDSWWPGLLIVVVTLLTAAGLVWVSFATGPRPRWRWGSRPDDDPGEDF
jgi:protein-S-isoprenylcysteine O-methyltransferase Ste14